MVIQIKTQQTPTQTQPVQPQVPTKSPREIELETALQNLIDKNYALSLRDETSYRIENLTQLNQIAISINRMAVALESFLEELRQAQTGEAQ